MDMDFSYHILNENETKELKQHVLNSAKVLSKKYYNLYCQKYGLTGENKGLLKSLWYVIFFSNAYGEDSEKNLNYVLEKCPNPASIRSFVYRLNKKNESTMAMLRKCEMLGVEKRKKSLLTPAHLFQSSDRVFIEIPPANSRALQCQNLVEWFNGYLPETEDLFQLKQTRQIIEEKTANGVKEKRQVFDYRFLYKKQEKRIGKFLSSVAADLNKMKVIFENNPQLKRAFLEFLEKQKNFSKKDFFEFKVRLKCKELYLVEPVVFYQLKRIASFDEHFDKELNKLIERYERETAILQEIETKKLSENEQKEVANMLVLSIRPMDIARKSTFTSWTSCNDVNGKFGSDYALKYIPDEIGAYSIVAYGVNKNNPAKPLCRCLINPYVNSSDKSGNKDKFYVSDRMYGEIIPTLRLILDEVIKNELNGGFNGSGMYNFKGHSPENCPMHILFEEGEKVRDLDVFMEMMKRSFGAVYNYNELEKGVYSFDEFELFPDEEVDFRGSKIDCLKIPRLTPGIDLGKGIRADTVLVRKIFCEKMPKNLTMERLIFDDSTDQAHPDERVKIPHNITVDTLEIKSSHITEIPADLNANVICMNMINEGRYKTNPLENFKTFNHIRVEDFSSDAGMTKELLSTINVTNSLDINNYQSETLPMNVSAKSIDLSNSKIKRLPSNMYLCDLDISDSCIEQLPANLEIEDFFCAENCPNLTTIGSGFKCSGSVLIKNTAILNLPSDMNVHNLSLKDNENLKSIPKEIEIEHLDLSGFIGTIHYSKHYKSIKLNRCLPLIHPDIPNEIIKGVSLDEILKAKQEYKKRQQLKIINSKQKDNR